MPPEISPPRISSNMTASQPIAGVEVETARGKKRDADRDEEQIEH
jgi:hypothetical protein